MIRIAVVGNIGSGKSHIAKLFNYPIFNADLEVVKIYKTNKKIFKILKKKIPKYFSTFPVKKEEIIKTIMDNKTNLKKITNIIHPEVRKKMNTFLKDNKKEDSIKFLYTIKIADFYFRDTALEMIGRIIKESPIKNPKIKKFSDKKHRVYLGPFSNINSLQKSYNSISILQFENIEIIKND